MMSLSRWILLGILAFLTILTVVMIESSKNLYKALPATLDTSVPVIPFEEWKEFTFDQSHFAVAMPALPQHATESLPEPKTHEKRKYDMYVAQQDNGTTFMVSLITYPNTQETSAPDQLFQTVMDEMKASNAKNEVLSVKKEQFLGNPAIDFAIQNDELHIQTTAFVLNDTLYLLSCIAKKELFRMSEYQHFIDSFTLLNPLK